ncbi:HD domain-containing protein [Halorussus sp. MSC15.2]|uniref:HD domain-containing protein n=1 Tax=Halorussus sp. MSC15.2 TaxID=2283638 RepID=UPI0013D38802|nr:HD domain-containing protein [Halorussus sp. MSC15.2]NEU58290.1 HD domain-containing protein [Halorussus sp. MSC15.2]
MTQQLGPLAQAVSLSYYEDALPGHDEFHANRVRSLSVRLANEWERTVDREVLSAAAWLHDIGRPLERSGEIENHDRWAAEEARDLLENEEVAADRIEAVQHCIRTHSIRSSSPDPESPEAKLLFDADKLEATGAVGIARMACIVGERSGRAGEKYAAIGNSAVRGVETSDVPDIALLRDWAKERLARVHTPPGRRLGESRWRFMEEFFAQFDREIGVHGKG